MSDAEALALLADEIRLSTDRLSRAEAKAVAHSVYCGDWLAAYVESQLARVRALAEEWHHPLHGDACWGCELARALPACP